MQGTSTARPERTHQPNVVGQLLRDWRASRGMSQLELAMQAGFSPRHVSFIETGRAQPSRQALLVIAESLDIPLRERNRLLEAGGYAHVYRQTPLAAEEMAHIRGVLQFILDRHAPYAAVVLDRYSNVVMGNVASERLVTALVDPSLLAEPLNYLRVTFHPQGARRWIVNWDELSRHLLARTELELGLTINDPRGADLLDELRRHMGSADMWRPSERTTAADLLVPIHVKKGDVELRLFCTFMTLGTPQDVTLQELRIETFFPADEASERTWREMFWEG
jgi:transcriptional regulator with XRE-family HTH domain